MILFTCFWTKKKLSEKMKIELLEKFVICVIRMAHADKVWLPLPKTVSNIKLWIINRAYLTCKVWYIFWKGFGRTDIVPGLGFVTRWRCSQFTLFKNQCQQWKQWMTEIIYLKIIALRLILRKSWIDVNRYLFSWETGSHVKKSIDRFPIFRLFP